MNPYKQSLIRLREAARLTEAMLDAAVAKKMITEEERAEIMA